MLVRILLKGVRRGHCILLETPTLLTTMDSIDRRASWHSPMCILMSISHQPSALFEETCSVTSAVFAACKTMGGTTCLSLPIGGQKVTTTTAKALKLCLTREEKTRFRAGYRRFWGGGSCRCGEACSIQ